MISLPLNSDLESLEKSELINLIYSLKSQLESNNRLSNEEQICIQQIKLLTEKSFDRELDTDEAKRFEIFHKNLRMARGQVVDATPKKKTEKMTPKQLMDIVNG